MTPASRSFVCSLVAGCLMVVGCEPPKVNRRGSQRSATRAGGTQQTALLRSIRTQLRTLPEASELELSPPQVIVDKRVTRDGEDVKAVLQRAPGVIVGLANVLVAKSAGVNFREAVRPGDVAKFYAVYDRETQDRLRQTGDIDSNMATFRAVDFRVAQVLGADSLLVEGGLPEEFNLLSKLEVWRYSDDRMNEISNRLGAYVVKRDPPLAWHPSPDAATINQLTERLNQWLRQSKLAGGKAKPPADSDAELSAPEPLAADKQLEPYLNAEDRRVGYFREYEVRQVQGAIWRRDVARWAKGSGTSAMAVAESLFDWTVRNLQLVRADKAPPRWPWEMMLHGQATAAGRAWVFAGLCEQQNVTAAILLVSTAAGGERTLVGVADGEALRVFDPELGLSILAGDGQTVASLADLQGDDALLRALDLPEEPYPLASEQLASVKVRLAATPLALTRRAEALESQLTAADAVVLRLDAKAATERLKKAAGVEAVSLWSQPFQTLLDKLIVKSSLRKRAVKDFLPFAWRPRLWRARTQHLRGAKAASDEKAGPGAAELIDDHRDARRYYMSRRVRPADRLLANEPPEKRAIYGAGKIAATIALGLITYDEGAYDVSAEWLENSALQGELAADFRPTIEYNLARAYQRLGETDRAIELLEATKGPSARGAKLLAKRWAAAAEDEPAEADEPAATDSP